MSLLNPIRNSVTDTVNSFTALLSYCVVTFNYKVGQMLILISKEKMLLVYGQTREPAAVMCSVRVHFTHACGGQAIPGVRLNTPVGIYRSLAGYFQLHPVLKRERGHVLAGQAPRSPPTPFHPSSFKPRLELNEEIMFE